MKKAINLQAQVHLVDPYNQAQFQDTLQKAFTQANPGLTLRVKSLSTPDAQGKTTLRVYIEGEQDPAANFLELTTGALHQVIDSLLPKPAAKTLKAQSRSRAATNIQETENDDENEDVVLPPKNPAT